MRTGLTDDFRIRRSNPKLGLQNRAEAIEFIRGQEPAERTILGETVWLDQAVGVVVSTVALATQPDAIFQNIKVFVRSDGWRCSYWQVTKVEHSPTSGD
jgi:hypothetical protein